VLGEALASGPRIADPPALQRYALAVLGALDVRLDVGPGAGPGGRLAVPPDIGHLDVPPDIGSAPGPGAGSATGTLIVANHSSWLDVLALTAAEPVPLVAKREVAGWPVIGALARRAGTRFVDLDALRRLPCFVDDLAAHLRSGESVAVFPQGTTWCTPPGGPFRRAAFQAAIDAGAPVRPVAVGFTQAGSTSSAAAYVGDDTLAASLRRVVTADGLVASVRPCAPLWPQGHDRRSLAEAAHEAVRRAWSAEPGGLSASA
jgi:1-acyl-sn-glycerol-3-phosphate acyltransferase